MKTLVKSLLCVCLGWAVGTSFSEAASPGPASGERPAAATGSEKQVETPAIIAMDVALSGKEGVLLGQVVDPNGGALANQSVTLTADNRVLARSRSDARGYFAFRHLRGGVYQVISSKGFVTVRAWAAGTAPRSAKASVLLVIGRETVRAQYGRRGGYRGGGIGGLLRSPIVVAGIVTAAVAVPLSVNDSTQDTRGSAMAAPEGVTGGTQVPASP